VLTVRLIVRVGSKPTPLTHDNEKTAMLLEELAALHPVQRRKVAEELRKVSETFADVPDGKTASHVLGVLAHLLDPA
jgi:hypothetical protein